MCIRDRNDTDDPIFPELDQDEDEDSDWESADDEPDVDSDKDDEDAHFRRVVDGG